MQPKYDTSDNSNLPLADICFAKIGRIHMCICPGVLRTYVYVQNKRSLTRHMALMCWHCGHQHMAGVARIIYNLSL